ncbi:hypothetical protein WJX72_001080 [[Myrmecia] bisecta]|uniref:GOLD domain-containing protein n=1 Tax=[Myrmecia] bisecta TaxID=41462 RepID=A0AAW1Q0B1_9CHLO
MNTQVEAPSGQVVHSTSDQQAGQFSFTAAESGDYKACFTGAGPHEAAGRKLRLDWRTGAAAKNWDSTAKAENTDAVALELQMLEATVKEIHADLLYLRAREEQMRDLNEATNATVAWSSICSVIISLLASSQDALVQAHTMAGPAFRADVVVTSSAHDDYKGREIQLHSRANRFDATTTSQDEYRQWALPPHEARAAPPPRQAVPFEGNSTYHDMYPTHQIQPRPHAEPVQYKGTGVKFDATSSYGSDYKQHPIEPRPPIMPTQAARSTAKFDATSSYSSEFPAHKIQPRQVHEGPKYTPNNVPWEATTAYNDNFKVYEIEKRAPIMPAQAARSTAKFDGTTTSHEAYKAYAIEPRAPHTVDYKYQPTPFEGTSESADKYKQWELEKRAPPAPAPIRASIPFNGTTTNQDTFKGWELPKKRPSLGIAMVGDQFHVLIPSTQATPCTAKQIFTTVHPNQAEMCMLIYQGDNPQASRNQLLGQFQLTGLPPGHVGAAQIEVSFHLDANNVLAVEARDLDSGRHHQWKHGGGAMIAAGVDAAMLQNGIMPMHANRAVAVSA